MATAVLVPRDILATIVKGTTVTFPHVSTEQLVLDLRIATSACVRPAILDRAVRIITVTPPPASTMQLALLTLTVMSASASLDTP